MCVASLFAKFGYDAWPYHSISWSIPKKISRRCSRFLGTNLPKTPFVFPCSGITRLRYAHLLFKFSRFFFPFLYSGQIKTNQSELGSVSVWVPWWVWLGAESVPSQERPGTSRNAQEQVDSSPKFKHCITLLHTINGPHRMKMTIVCVRLLCERLHHYSSKLFERCLVFTRRYLVGAEIQRRVFWWKLAFDSVKTDNKLVGAAALFNADSSWKRGRSREGRAAVSWLASFVLVR